jgi:hypothetical protein
MKFKCVIATTNVDSDGEQFTPEALQQLADTAVGKPLKWNFETDLPGQITKAYVENGQLWVEGESPIDLFLVPGFVRPTPENDGKFSLFAAGLTHMPVDLSLPSIQIEPGATPDWFPQKKESE